jgi:signal transduction histidine kinase
MGIREMIAVGPMRLGASGMQRLVDLATLGLVAAILARWSAHEILLQALWVVAGIGAVVYGLRHAIVRIVLITAGAAAYTLTGWLVDEPSASDLADGPEVAEWALMIGVGLLVAYLANRIATSARRYAALYREASERLLIAHEQERGRLARDIHDGVGQTLTAVILTLDAARAQLPDASAEHAPRAARVSIDRAQALAANALSEARGVAAQLRPARIEEIGLGAALANLARDAGVAVQVRFDPAILPAGILDPDREIDLYRIVQEALSNAARHSGARRIWIDATVTTTELALEVGDNGRGIDPARKDRGLGLAGMDERATILAARLELRTHPGEGTVIRLVMRLGPEPAPAVRRTALSGASAPI